ncbi:MAG TPA: hypothetical protein VEQ40_11260 [Pyrinomonadaceae bacterium]|nr:hypothetical protein [Pyrinomonadaceae bacterium]
MSAVHPHMTSINPPPMPAATDARPLTAAQCVLKVREALGELWLPYLYRTRILSLRTRAHHLEIVEKENAIEVQHTLLGVELKTGRRRMLCPDFSTARYLAAFARIGCKDVALPYDITQISRLADELESSWQRMLLLIEREAGERTPAFRRRVRALLVKEVREELREAGAGTAIPQFNQNTKQRRS